MEVICLKNRVYLKNQTVFSDALFYFTGNYSGMFL